MVLLFLPWHEMGLFSRISSAYSFWAFIKTNKNYSRGREYSYTLGEEGEEEGFCMKVSFLRCPVLISLVCICSVTANP